MSLEAFAVIGFLTGLLIGMNPVLISSFSAYITTMIGRSTSNSRYTLAGFLFILYFVLFLLFFGVGFASFISYLDLANQFSIALIISVVAIAFGLTYIRRYFYNEPLVTPSKNVTEILHDKTTKRSGILNVMALSIVVVYATLPSIGLAIAVMAVMGAFLGVNSLAWSIPFLFGLITPIYIILALLSNSTKPSAILSWKEKSKAVVRLYSGLALILLAWLLLFVIAGGEIS